VSKKNIIKTEHLNGKAHVTFQTEDGTRKYEYVGSSARAIKRGKTDPSQLLGRLIEHKKD
jgi:hypothetical protein